MPSIQISAALRAGFALALVLALGVDRAQAFNDPVNGLAKYTSICFNCHSADPTQDRTTVAHGFAPAPSPAGASAANLQSLINGGMGSPLNDGLKTGSNAIISSDVSDVAAYITNPNFSVGSVNPTFVAFGTVTRLGPPFPSASIRLNNTGPGALTVTNVAITDATNFGVDASACAAPVAGNGGHCDIVVSFRPQADGDFPNRTLTITHNGVNGSNVVFPISGSRVDPFDVTTPLPYSTTTAQTQFVHITDREGVALQVCRQPGATFDGKTHYTVEPPFALIGDCVTIPAAGGVSPTTPRNLDLGVTFTAAGVTTPLNAELQVQQLPSGFARTVDLRANAGPVLTVDATNLFTGVNREADGSVFAEAVLTVSNRGNQPLAFAATPYTVSDSQLAAGVCSPIPQATTNTEYTLVPVTGVCDTAAGLPAFLGGPTPPSCSVKVRFDPADVGTRCAVLGIHTNAGEARIVLEGFGFHGARLVVTENGAARAPGLVMDFTSQRRGIAYPPRVLALSNGGTLGDLELALPAQGAVSGYTIVPSAACGQPLPPSAPADSACTLTIAFAPTLVQTYPGAFDIGTRAAGTADPFAAFAVNLTGKGTDTAPSLAWRDAGSTPVASLDFAAKAVGAPPGDGQLGAVLSNAGPGSASLQLFNAVGVDGANFVVDASACPVGGFLNENAMCTVLFRFVPGTPGNKSAEVQVASDGNGPGPLVLRGTASGGAPPPQLSIDAMPAFGATAVGSRSAPLALTLANRGVFALRVLQLDVTGPFAVQGNTCPALPFTLAAGSTCTLGVTFQPTAPGPTTGTLNVTTDASATPAAVDLAGDARPPPDLSSGGCSLAAGDSLVDPMLWALAIVAALALLHRRRARERGGRPHRGAER